MESRSFASKLLPSSSFARYQTEKKPVDNRVPDWQRTNLVDGETKQTVRCVNDDLEHGSYLYWKGMVEQVTYIYVPHNGYYRTMKDSEI